MSGPSPRVRGNPESAWRSFRFPGPSPRVRGNPGRTPRGWALRGSIPACAGKPGTPSIRPAFSKVHPRVCGETHVRAWFDAGDTGPSPCVRGNPGTWFVQPNHAGSIPACAGKPCYMMLTTQGGRVHPRVCGETRFARCQWHPRWGPSPRVRGNHLRSNATNRHMGSIPACAGKPARRGGYSLPAGVHPRVCGETVRLRGRASLNAGPSPRVRGNPHVAGVVQLDEGSIPACAGKPGSSGRCSPSCRVHPRVCGETRPHLRSTVPFPGPSPRVRGNPNRIRSTVRAVGSIPACAGKPGSPAFCRNKHRVHPPRVRGNLCLTFGPMSYMGSIPACAGKPIGYTRFSMPCRVHPRVCGETRVRARASW